MSQDTSWKIREQCRKMKTVSLVILTYNQENYISECLKSILEQTHHIDEIIVQDDKSKDKTFEIIKEFEIIFKKKMPSTRYYSNKNKTNLGVIKNFSDAVSKSSGDIIIGCAGDDFFRKDRVAVIRNIFDNNQEVIATFSNARIIDSYSQIRERLFVSIPKNAENINDFILFNKCWVHGATAAYSARIFNEFPPLYENNFQEDGALAFRSLLLGKVEYIDEELVFYRKHIGSVSDTNNISKRIAFYKNKKNLVKSYICDFLHIKSKLKMTAKSFLRIRLSLLLMESYLLYFFASTKAVSHPLIKTYISLRKKSYK